MSKIKEKLLNDDSFLEDAINDFFEDDDYYYQKYIDECDCNNDCPCKEEPAFTMEEMNQNWNDWWDSLTDDQKQELCQEQIKAEEHFNKYRDIEDVSGPNANYGV